MPSVDQPRARAQSIPARLPVDRREAGRIPYRASPSSSPRPDAHDDEDSRPLDCDVETPSASTVDSKPQQARQDDDMLSLPHINSSSSDIAAPAPALPAKSALRASRLLASLQQKASSEERPILPHAAPHQVYLSSEEDASSSADDFSDFDELDSDSEQSQQSSGSRASHEVTARVVTVVFHGRPSIVELPRRASASGSTDARRPATGILRTVTEPTLRTRSISSSSSTAFQHPPRSSSMLPSGFEKKRPQFLTIDPFAAKTSDHDEQESARTPKTPTAMLRKTLSLVRKRSKPVLNQSAARPRESFSTHPSPMAQVGEEAEPDTPREACPANKAPASYHDIMRSARRNAEVPTPKAEVTSPLSPDTHRSRFRRGLSISRPRSIRA
ncbi:Uncharacterized protein TPAR_00226 [Tolypocladium paradoxum]|uniref:Uncharacterized protein n=1 Tax=Tolypocladium paradoxum TaxID=94208 RepID=A0A2S4LAY4_9HYPO|nr:Uncharacterized protein TPAR_00226 [Tolypocladium paradoxum]